MYHKDENIEELFKELKGTFDLEEPREGHQERFLEKLSAARGVVHISSQRRNWWKPLSIAASFILLFGLGIAFYTSQPTVEEQVAEISPEASQTHFYFANLIEEQVKELKEQSGPETQAMVDDALQQLEKLEADYDKLEKDLIEGGDSKLILSAMIMNFQTRIDLLQDVMNQIDNIKNINNYNDENFTI